MKKSQNMKCLIEEFIPRGAYDITKLCNDIGITRTTYYNILKGSIPNVFIAVKIVRWFNDNSNYPFTFSVEDFWK